ncbi:MAG: glycoside hydrolase family 3 protein [Bacilli bacterium]|nr:glycoside hydrolase family 3 protein [Bacilli bacterium]
MKKNLFKGLGATFGALLSVTAFMSVLAFDREADINRVLNITTNAPKSGGSAYANKDEMLVAEKDYIIRTQEEGSVLLTNKNNALPLKDGKNVTLFGNASVYATYHGGSGGPSNAGVSLHDALKSEGFNINEDVFEATKSNGRSPSDKDIREVDADIYSGKISDSYKDAAIVVFGRFAGEANDMDTTDSYGVPELSFHDSEKKIMELVKNSGFKKIVVLLNTGYAMDLDWLDDYQVDACMWIGYPGAYGMTGVAKMLKGEVSPSGSLSDTYATNSLSSPAMQNFGDISWGDLPVSLYHDKYVVYAEGIYVGYKYYETRYFDQVQNKNNASGPFGVFSGSTQWNYADEMQFSFGYGLTYTTFEESVESITWDKTSHKLKASIKVKNTGSFKAKDSVQLYASLPYESGNAQKSAIQLVGFAKTSELDPNKEETVSIEVSDYLFATYDENATNGKDSNKKGCYVFDKGDYYFSIGNGAHDALNNVMAKMGITGMTDEKGNSVSGNAALVVKDSLAALDNTTWATSPYTDKVVSNQFPEVNINNYKANAVEYLTRDDWSTFPERITGLTTEGDTSGELKKNMTARAELYTTPSDAPDYKDFKHSQPVTIKFVEMKGVEYDDEKWETFIDQLTPTMLATLYGDKMGYDAIGASEDGINYPGCTGVDGPDGLQRGGVLHTSENLSASTFNLDLLEERGKFLAEDAMYLGLTMVYGGGCNMHRTPYGGRNFEYFSEDSTLAYLCGEKEATAMRVGGLIGMNKHFCGNDQETNRHGVATFMTEQVLRQNETRSFEGALHLGSGMSNMSAYNRLGVIPTASYKALMTTLLREEWGTTGISITDSSKDASSYIFTGDAVDAGTDMFNNDADRTTEVKNWLIKQRDGHIWSQARISAKRFFYNMANSNLTVDMTADTVVKETIPWWKPALITLNVSLGVLALAGISMYVVLKYVLKKEDK